LPALKATVIAGLDRTQSKGFSRLTNQNINGFFNSGVNQGRYSYGTGETTQELLDAYLNYNKAFGKVNVDVTAGHSYQEKRVESFSSGETYDPNNVINSLDYFLRPVSKLESYFGRANLGYDGKYLLTLNLRNDITNNFSPENRSGIFPGVAFAWVVSKESFMNDSKAFNNLKLRLGWGVTGQQDLNTNVSYIPKYISSNQGSDYQFGTTIISPVAPAFYSDIIKWEETTTINAGLDFDIYKRVKGSIDVYKKESKDLLADVSFPDGANLSNFGPRNFGNLEVKGVELALNTDLVKNDNVNWNVNFNASYQDRKITATALDGTGAPGFEVGGIRGGVGNNIQIHSTNFAPNSFYVYEQVYGTDGKPLEGVFVDRNGDGNISAEDKYHYKKPYADFTFGLMSNLAYKKWDFSMAWRASLGNYMYDNNASSYGYLANSINQITPLNNINPSFFETGFVNEGNNRYFSDYFVKDASFIKLDNISVGYNIEKPFGETTSAKLSFGVQNALIISNYKGIDPEIFSGIDQTIYPRARMFVLGCNVNF
jgi:iron complex outermembrane receptor protein